MGKTSGPKSLLKCPVWPAHALVSTHDAVCCRSTGRYGFASFACASSTIRFPMKPTSGMPAFTSYVTKLAHLRDAREQAMSVMLVAGGMGAGSALLTESSHVLTGSGAWWEERHTSAVLENRHGEAPWQHMRGSLGH